MPTWRSMGVDIAILHWRGLLRPARRARRDGQVLEQTIARLMKTAAWKKALERHQWFDGYADAATFRKDMEQENTAVTEVLTGAGDGGRRGVVASRGGSSVGRPLRLTGMRLSRPGSGARMRPTRYCSL